MCNLHVTNRFIAHFKFSHISFLCGRITREILHKCFHFHRGTFFTSQVLSLLHFLKNKNGLQMNFFCVLVVVTSAVVFSLFTLNRLRVIKTLITLCFVSLAFLAMGDRLTNRKVLVMFYFDVHYFRYCY